MITAAQCKMARAGIGWSIQRLAAAAHVGVATVARFETGKGETIPATLAAIQRALEAAGVEFLSDDGVRLKGAQVAHPAARGSQERRAVAPSAKPSRSRKPLPKAKPAAMSKAAQIRALRERAG